MGAAQGAQRGAGPQAEGERTAESSRYYCFAFPFLIFFCGFIFFVVCFLFFSAKTISPWALISSSGWETLVHLAWIKNTALVMRRP